MGPVNSYNSKYGKNNDKPVCPVTKDRFEISASFTDEQKLFLYVNAVPLVDIQPSRSNE